MRPRAWLATALFTTTTLLTMACGKRTVPFKRDPAEPTAIGPEAGPLLPAPKGETFPANTRKVSARGHDVTIDAGSIRAVLELPSDAPESGASLLLLTERADGSLALERRLAQPSGWSNAQPLAVLIDRQAQQAEPCALDSLRLDPLSSSAVLAEAKLSCPRHASPTPDVERRAWAIAVAHDAPARVLQRLSIVQAAGATPILRAAHESRDLDNDGRPDLLLRIELQGDASAAIPIELKFFDRASGAVADTTEPEQTFRKLADEAVTAHNKRDASAEARALAITTLHSAICREPGAPQLRIDGRGLDCGPSLGAGRAASVMAAERARAGKLADALALARASRQPFYQLAQADTDRIQQALKARAEPGRFEWREATTHIDLARAPQARHGALSFIDEGRLLIRGPTARSYDLASGRIEPVGIAAPLTLLDPSGRLAVASIKRSCEGYHIAIVRASQVVAGIVTGPSVSEPLFAPAPAPAGARCPELAPEQRRDQGGYRAIEWSSMGVIIAHHQSLFVLPLDEHASATSSARALGPGEALPARTYSSELTPDGWTHVWVSPEGIAIHDRKQDAIRILSPPSGTGPLSDVAISPSGRLLAALRGRQLFIGMPEALAAPPAR